MSRPSSRTSRPIDIVMEIFSIPRDSSPLRFRLSTKPSDPMGTARLGWRIYVRHTHFDYYAYTIIGAKGEAEAFDIARSVITPGNLKLRGKLVTIDLDDYPPPPPTPEENQS